MLFVRRTTRTVDSCLLQHRLERILQTAMFPNDADSRKNTVTIFLSSCKGWVFGQRTTAQVNVDMHRVLSRQEEDQKKKKQQR